MSENKPDQKVEEKIKALEKKLYKIERILGVVIVAILLLTMCAIGLIDVLIDAKMLPR